MSIATLITADQLLRMPRGRCRYELIAGELTTTSPGGWRHGLYAGRLHGWLSHHVEKHRLGEVFEGDTGFLLASDPDTVRAPDVAFIRRERLLAEKPSEAFWPGAPDLAVEVVSPGDTIHEVDDKVKAWLEGGAALVWVVNPKWQSVTVYRSASQVTILTAAEELSGEDVVAGFRCKVGDIFAA